MKNPFEFGRELGADELVNRTDELRIIRQAIMNGSKLFVIGPRRFGKTSLLKSTAERISLEDQIVLRYNAEAFPDLSALVRRIVQDSAKALQGQIESTGEKIRHYFRALKPEISFAISQTEWKVSLGVTPTAEQTPTAIFADALDGLESFAASLEGKTVALIIDEFQEVIAQGGLAAERQIRSAIQSHKHTSYVFAGSKTRMLSEMTTDPSRPFYRLGSLLYVGALPRPEFSRFLIDKFTLGGFFSPRDDETARRDLALKIISLSDDVPYNVQMLAHSLWNRLTESNLAAPGTVYLRDSMINEALENLIRQNDPFYTQVWNGLTSVQKKTLIAVIEFAGRNLQSAEVTGRFGIGASSIRKSLESLSSRDILRQNEAKGAIEFKFEDPFLAHWILRFSVL